MGLMRKYCNILTKLKKKCSFLKIDISFFVIFVVSILLDSAKLYLCYLVFGCLHELSHYLVAKHYGYLPKKIHLSFFGASLEGYDDFLIRDEIKVILAGPMFNLTMVCLCYISFWFYPESSIFLHDILIANLSLFVFNMMPIFPLDFGRILLAVTSIKYSRLEAVKRVKKWSLFVICLLFVLFLISLGVNYNFSFGFMITNLAFLCLSSAKDTSFKRQVFARKKIEKLKSGLSERNIYVKSGTENFRLFKFIDDSHFVNFVFVDENFCVEKKLTEIEFYKENDLI